MLRHSRSPLCLSSPVQACPCSFFTTPDLHHYSTRSPTSVISRGRALLRAWTYDRRGTSAHCCSRMGLVTCLTIIGCLTTISCHVLLVRRPPCASAPSSSATLCPPARCLPALSASQLFARLSAQLHIRQAATPSTRRRPASGRWGAEAATSSTRGAAITCATRHTARRRVILISNLQISHPRY